MSKKTSPYCAKCPTFACTPQAKVDEPLDLSAAPNFCPMEVTPEVLEKAMAEYEKPEVKEFARLASLQEAECFEKLPNGRRTKNPRIVELIEFSRKLGYKRLGLAFCGGFSYEAKLLTEILEANGFEVISARCKVGGVIKEKLGIKPEQKIGTPDSREPMCNPIAQAEILNNAKVDLAVMMGLCIGHDVLFIRYCRVPLTVFAVKDRVTGHNPLAPLYTSNSYYARLKTGI